MISRVVSFLLLLYLLGYCAFAVFLPGAADDRVTDGIVVLTGSKGRIERGLDLMQRRRAQRLLISGVARTVRPAELAAEYRADPRLFACCIDLGRESVDTRSNAEETARWLAKRGFRSVRLVTTDWHMRRAGFELRRQSPNVAMVGDAVPSNPSFRQLFTEYNKYLLRRAAVIVGI